MQSSPADEKRILLVDDDTDFRESLADVIGGSGCRVAVAASAREALASLRDRECDVVFVDARLGGDEGTRLVRDIQGEFPLAVCVVMTAYAGPGTAVQALRVGAYDYLVKPFEIDELFSTLERCLEKVRLQRANARAREALEAKARELAALNERLAESERFYREVFDTISDGVFVTEVTPDRRYRLVSYNPAQERMLGISAAANVGRFSDDYLPPEVARKVRNDNDACIAAGRTMSFDGWIDLPAGRSYYHTTLVPLRNTEGRIHRLIGVTRDDTERERFEQALRLSEEKFAKAFNDSPDAMSISRLADGVLLEVNPGFLQMYGAPREEVIGRSTLASGLGLWADDAERERLSARLLETGAVVGEEITIRRRDGSLLHGLTSLRIIEIEGERCVLVVTRDVTEKRRMETAFRESEERFRLLAENSTDLITRHDPDLVCRYASPASLMLLGFEPDRLVGRSLYHFIHRGDAASVAAANRALLEHDTPVVVTYRIRRRDGSTIWLETSSRAIRDARTGAVREIQASTRDVSERIRSAEREREQERQLFQAAKLVSLGTLVSGVAHEINNPNNFIRLNVQNLREFWPDVREACRRASADDPGSHLHGIPNERAYGMVDSLLNGIEEGSRRIEKLLANLRDFARGDEGSLDESVDLNAVVRSAVMIARSGIYRATEAFAFSEAAGLPPVRGNYHQIEQVVLNLITNACQALPSRDRGITVSTDRVPGTDGAVLRVEDQGAGIPADVLPRITDPFFTTKRGVGGSGLGLAVSSRIVANHGARMEFESEVGRGTTVTVTFPGTGVNR